MKCLFIIIFSFLVTLISIYRIIRLTTKKGIGIDLPDKRRKMHKNPTPRLGGIGIAFGFLSVLSFVSLNEKVLSFLLGTVIILVIGFLDDIKGVSWRFKMFWIFVATSVIMFYGDIRIVNLGNFLNFGDINLGIWSIPFTYFFVLGIVSSVNMIDGLNGLAAGISLIASLSLAYFSYLVGDYNFMYINLAVCGGIIAFLIFNFPSGRIFLGDSGSMMLGFSIAITSIVIFQKGRPCFEPIIPMLIVAIPIYDTLRIMGQRLLKRKNPFLADKTHLHHLLVRCGVCDKKASTFIWLLSLIFSLAAILLRHQTGWLLFTILICGYCIISIFIAILLETKRNKGKKIRLSSQRLVTSIQR